MTRKQSRADRLGKDERAQMVDALERDPSAFCVNLFASHQDWDWWEKNWMLVPSGWNLEDYIFTKAGDLRPALEPYERYVNLFLSRLHPTTYNGLLVQHGANAFYNREKNYWKYEYRLPFDANACRSWDRECDIHPRGPCVLPSLVLEFVNMQRPARIFFCEPNAGILTETENYWHQFWGERSLSPWVGFQFYFFQYFLLMRAYSIQVIHLGLDTFRKVLALLPETVFKSGFPQNHGDRFYAALRQVDATQADAFARKLAWNLIETLTIDTFDVGITYIEDTYGFIEAFLKDEADLLRFLRETRSPSLRDALLRLGSRVPPKISRYLENPAWLAKKRGTGWRGISTMGNTHRALPESTPFSGQQMQPSSQNQGCVCPTAADKLRKEIAGNRFLMLDKGEQEDIITQFLNYIGETEINKRYHFALEDIFVDAVLFRDPKWASAKAITQRLRRQAYEGEEGFDEDGEPFGDDWEDRARGMDNFFACLDDHDPRVILAAMRSILAFLAPAKKPARNVVKPS